MPVEYMRLSALFIRQVFMPLEAAWILACRATQKKMVVIVQKNSHFKKHLGQRTLP